MRSLMSAQLRSRRQRAALALKSVARKAVREIAAPMLLFALPTKCFACGRLLGHAQHRGACASCWSALRPLNPPICASCGIPAPRSTDLLGPAGGRCPACVLSPPAFDGVCSAVEYDEVARAFLLSAKSGRRRELFRDLGEHLARVLAVSDLAVGIDAVVPVPSHPWRRFRRGFDPALEIARLVARRTQLPLREGVLLHRWSSTVPFKRLGAVQRRVASRRLFTATGRVAGSILLVDDVVTTGATAAACSVELKRAGASEVRVAAWARTPRRPAEADVRGGGC